MLGLSHCQRIFLVRARVDMRKGRNGLAALVRVQVDRDSHIGDTMDFICCHRSMMKILSWDVSRHWLASNRLERGTFAVAGGLGACEAWDSHAFSVAQIMAILEGIEVRSAGYRQHFSHPPSGMNALMTVS